MTSSSSGTILHFHDGYADAFRMYNIIEHIVNEQQQQDTRWI